MDTPFSIISSRKTPGSAGGLTEFDSSGNTSAILAPVEAYAVPLHGEYRPMMNHLFAWLNVLNSSDCG